MSFTANCLLDNRAYPVDPFKFGKDVQYSQDRINLEGRHKVLFNKGRYFETSIYNKDLLINIATLVGVPILHGNMIVASWKNLEDFVIAMNIYGYYVEIEIDWI